MYTRKATATRFGAFGLRERLLFCVKRRPLPPRELMDALGMVKSNVTLLANKCIADGLLEKVRQPNDKRTLLYSLTEKGRETVDAILMEIGKKFTTILTDEKERARAEETLDAAVELLSFVP